MTQIPGYEITEQLQVSEKKIVYRAWSEERQKSVIIKILKAEYPSLEEITILKHEYQIAINLDVEGIIKAHSLEKYRNGFALVLEDIGGESLQTWLGRKNSPLNHTRKQNLPPCSAQCTSSAAVPTPWVKSLISLATTITPQITEKFLKDFLQIAISLAEIIGEIHQEQIIHKDIKPSNIIINPHTKQVKISDFSIATPLVKEMPQWDSQPVMLGTLAYMSPEQTGRMNRMLDYRTDFYSLGITYYEMLTGKLPFASNDSLELIHNHIAVTPIPPHKVNSEIPEAISAIIMKLLAKNAEDRYQSAWGLKADWEICLQHLREGYLTDLLTEGHSFIPGKVDKSSRFTIPQKLYGRSQEVNALLAAFARVAGQEAESHRNMGMEIISHNKLSASHSELILVAGYSGVGKTSVINEVHKPIVRQRGYFISGKFDQFQHDTPYAAIIKAFQSLIGQLLTQTTNQIAAWREKLLSQLGENGQVIIDVIPELELIIGSQPTVLTLSPSASENLFHRVFQQFVSTFTQPEHPLVLFLDDLQWADHGSLKLIETLMDNHQSGYLLLIGAYRDNEVSPTHPLIHTLSRLEEKNTPINEIVLQPLAIEHINQLLADTLEQPQRSIISLAQLLFHKTGGNPFFLTQLLHTLHGEHLLRFDFGENKWGWDIEQIQAIGIADYNVVELVARNLQKLPPETQQVLQLAACIGNQFSLSVLAVINQKYQSDTAADLWQALQAGLILPLTNKYRLPLLFDAEAIETLDLGLKATISYGDANVNYKFLHDRVQQAAYSLIPDAQKQETHLRIGRLLRENTPLEEIDQHIFDIVNQLNIGVELLEESPEKQDLAQLNLLAGQKAKAASAYEAAHKYLHTGLRLLPESSWERDYELTLDTHRELLEVEYLKANFEQAEEIATLVISKAQNLLDTVKVYETKIQYHIAQSQMETAIDLALKVLKMLGIKLPANPGQGHILLGLGKAKLIQGSRKIEDLLSLPTMSDPQRIAAMDIINSTLTAAFTARPTLFAVALFKMVSLSLKQGNTPTSCFAYAGYGTAHCHILGDINTGYRYGQLALQLLEQFNATEIKSKIYMVFNTFIRPWKDHLEASIESLSEGIQIGLSTGDIEGACNGAAFYSGYVFMSGKALDFVSQKQSAYLGMVIQFKQEYDIVQTQLWHQVVLNLQGLSPEPGQLVGKEFDIQTMLPALVTARNNMAIFQIHLAQSYLAYWFKDYEQAYRHGCSALEYSEAVLGLVYVAVHKFYYCLTLLALYPTVTKPEQKQYLQQVSDHQKKMEHWATHCPGNYLHKYELVEAEKARVLAKNSQAGEFYDRAIQSARQAGYLQEEALANELAAEFYFAQGREKLTRMYLSDAYYGYGRWGAKAKVEDLKTRYPDFLAEIIAQETCLVDVTMTRTTSFTFTRGGSLELALDIATVIKASQAISGEIVLEKLLDKLMHILMESGGAQTGMMFLHSRTETDNSENGWLLAAQVSIEPQKVAEFPFLTISQDLDLPFSVINYVRSTKERLVLDHATTEELFYRDPYIVKHQPQSVLCLPIIYQNKLTAILYLANGSTQGAFTKERLQLLSLLSSQAAISLENSLLYSSLEDKVAQRTQELNQKNVHLKKTLTQLKKTQVQLIQSEKMSSLGQMVAGIAHEINNPVNFIYANLGYTDGYTKDLLHLVKLYQEYCPEDIEEIEDFLEEMDFEFLVKDLPNLVQSMREGANRIATIVKSLRNFSRLDESELKSVDIHDGIENTLLILQNRLKAKSDRSAITVVKNYTKLPQVECYASELNQVFLQIFTNAIDALEEAGREEPQISISTLVVPQNSISIEITDNGVGMTPEVIEKLFDPFFTTKPVGKGTGMGMSIGYQIVVDKHKGSLKCNSNVGEGTQLIITIPVRQTR